jgi:penicillin-binding protein 1A
VTLFRKPIDTLRNANMGGRYGQYLKKQRLQQILYKSMRYGSIAFGVFLGLLTIIVIQISTQLPDVDIISTYVPNETTKVFAADGSLLAELHEEENRALVPISKISDYIKAGVIASEDANFYYHHGLDFKGISRSMFTNLVFGSAVQGGSTITQQLARNVFLNKKKKVIRKIAEVILALQLERRYTKEEILEFYLNQVYWGHNAYGIESASNLYFGKNANQLSLAEAALLVGMLRGPEMYSPFVNPKKARWRQEIVLGRLLKLGLINEEEYYNAKDQPIFLASRKKLKYKHPYFTSYVVKQLEAMYGTDVVYNNGLKVYTTLDPDLQKRGEESLEYYLSECQKPHWVKGAEVSSLNCTQGSLLCIEPRTGYIRTWVGGRDFLEREFDHISQAKRQPGSSFKPYTYLTALSMGMSPGTVIDDLPVTFNTIQGPYAPMNYTKDFKGPLPLRRALELSINIIAIKISDMIDPSNIIVTCRKLGIQSYLAPVLSLTLGSSEISVLEHCSAYCVFANGGVKVDPVSILRIEDRNGNVLYKHELVEKRVYDSNKIYALVNMMRGVLLRGTGQGAYVSGYDIAGKTGTTNDYRDAWFIGFTPNLMCATWVGNDDNSTMIEMTGGWIPAQMWNRFMSYALKKYPKEYFPFPRGMIRQRICVEGKALAGMACPEDKVVEDLMWEDNPYTQTCQVHSLLSGVVSGGSNERSDWERTFYPDKDRIVYLSMDNQPKPAQTSAPVQPKKQKVQSTVDLTKGL